MTVFLTDSFTATGGTGTPPRILLNAWASGETGHTWNCADALGLRTDTDVVGGRIGDNIYYYATASAAPGSADYSVSFDVSVLTTNDFTATGAGARVSGVGRDSGYFATIDPNAQVLRLERHDAGTRVTLGATYDISGLLVTLPASILNVEVKCNGDQISALIDGVERVPPVTDTTYTAAGLAGFYHRVGSEFGDITVDNISGDTLAADTTAPTFTVAPAVTATTSSGHTISATLDEPGTLYGVRLANGAVAPNSAQVKAGQDSTGAAAPEAKSAAAANSADLVFSTGAASTAYDYYIVAEDDETTPNLQATPALVTDTTDAVGPSVSAADNITSEGDTVTFTLSGNSAAPVSATLNGTDVGTLSLVSGSTYSYVAPLIVDDATASLVVTVDSTTASATISYANSYPYELVTHGTPDANSIFFNTSFATVQPVEWGVVTDYNASIVTVDHAALDAAEDELNDVALHSTEVVEGSSTATYKYFVTETGATGTWQATIDVVDNVAPATTSVGVPTAGTYIIGQSLDFTGNWSEVVNIGGTPAINFTIGGQARQANYASGTGTAASVFSYAIQEGDSGGISVTSLTLDGGTIRDAALNDADLTLNAIGDTSGITVDGIRPVVSVNSLTTTDTDPIITGSSGDATSLTLVVTGIGTYNPVPSGGSWSQQLPISALGDYPMTLNGTDANGNAAVEAVGTLSIVEEVLSAIASIRQPIRSAVRQPLKRSI